MKISNLMMKFSWAISWVKWLSGDKTNISKTISVLVLRVLVWLWLGKNILSNLYLAQSVGGFNGSFAWISVMFEQQLCYRVPGPAQCEATDPVEVFVVESYLDCFLDETVHVS
jgi:hypothetical protein